MGRDPAVVICSNGHGGLDEKILEWSWLTSQVEIEVVNGLMSSENQLQRSGTLNGYCADVGRDVEE